MLKSKNLISIFTVVCATLFVAAVIFAWNEPSSVPPGDNVPTPLNTGTTAQVKNARLSATEFYDANDSKCYIDPDGESVLGKHSKLIFPGSENYCKPDSNSSFGVVIRVHALEDISKFDAVSVESMNAVIAYRADADNIDRRPAIGIATEDIPSGTYGRVLISGEASKNNWFPLPTNPSRQVYLSTTPGQLTVTPPTSADAVIQVMGIAIGRHALFLNPSLQYETSGGGGGDGNNYVTGISFSGDTTKTLTLNRSGLSNLTANFTDLTGGAGGDGNDYVDSVNFNTGNGFFTLGRTGTLSDLSIDLDGRYLTSYSETDPQVGTLTNGKWCTTNGSVVNCTSDAPGASSSGDIRFPDGYEGTAKNIILATGSYTVPAGKTLYITTMFNHHGLGNSLKIGGEFYYVIPHYVSLSSPLIVPAGSVLTSSWDSLNITGIEVSSGVTAKNVILATGSYTVPAGKTLYITTMFNHKDLPNYLKIGGEFYYGIPASDCVSLSSPLIVPAGSVLTSSWDSLNITGYEK
ncbi:hypothetical protein KAS79_01370 [Candidatus Parcubacteria bacterium]|nr:hypothetical protein [Candidatus Parcubacteria bacterium]